LNKLSGLLNQFRTTQDHLAETREKYKEASGGITERSKRLAELTDELEHIKQQMEERGVSLTDGGKPHFPHC
jgi:estrogen-related receptor beta like 1